MKYYKDLLGNYYSGRSRSQLVPFFPRFSNKKAGLNPPGGVKIEPAIFYQEIPEEEWRKATGGFDLTNGTGTGISAGKDE